MDILKNVLEELRSGRKKFTALSQSKEDIKDFQIIAKVLSFANDKGFIDGYLPHKNTETSDFYYDLIMVTNGLSYQGMQYLESGDEQNNTNTKDDILLLKPSFFGIGIDLNALWRRWKS